MLLAIDVGNTNITCAVLQNEETKANFRLTTKKSRTSDEFGIIICDLLEKRGINQKEIEAVIIASVVPGIMYSLTSGIIKYLNVSIIVLFIRNRYDIVNEIIGIIFLIVFVCFVVLSNILFINNNIIFC